MELLGLLSSASWSYASIDSAGQQATRHMTVLVESDRIDHRAH